MFLWKSLAPVCATNIEAMVAVEAWGRLEAVQGRFEADFGCSEHVHEGGVGGRWIDGHPIEFYLRGADKIGQLLHISTQ